MTILIPVGQEPGPPVFFPISSPQSRTKDSLPLQQQQERKIPALSTSGPRALDSAGSFEVTSTGGVVILLSGTTVIGNVNISGSATGSGATLPHQVCGATVMGNLGFKTTATRLRLAGRTAEQRRSAAICKCSPVRITSASISGNLTVQDNTSTVLLSGSTVCKNLQAEQYRAASNSTQVSNNQVSLNLLCSGNTSITGQGNTAKSKQGQCAIRGAARTPNFPWPI